MLTLKSDFQIPEVLLTDLRTFSLTAIKLRIFNFKSTVFSIAYDNSTKR
jgi:hypothetical protein